MTTRNQKRYENPRIVERGGANADAGIVRWDPVKSIWITAMYIGTFFAFTLCFSWSGLLLFFVTSGATLMAGHSVGMHRLLIHRSFACPVWLERALVYLGTLVGLGGPLTMMWTHDLRDWAQRQRRCHDYFAHRRPILQDAFWQMHCHIELERPPAFEPGRCVGGDRFYRFLEHTHMLQQLPWALLFLALGGIGWVLFGISARVAVSVTGHWLIGYFAHNRGGQHWRVEGAAVQGFDVDYCGLITFGECWHNNHHAFPGSAKLGICERQTDPGWWLILLLERIGWATDIKTPNSLPARPELAPVEPPVPVHARGRKRTPEEFPA